jgi:hypothetical protein
VGEKQFFRVFARLVEKVTAQPVDGEVDFNWRAYWDSDMPRPAQKLCARMAADEYLREYGYQNPLDSDELVSMFLSESLS